MKAGRLDEALSAVLRIRILDPMNDEARHIEGMIQAELGRSSITVSSEGLSDPSLGMPDLSRFAEQHPSHAVVDEPGEAESAASLPQPLEAEASDSPLAEPPRRSRKVFFIAVAGAAGLGLFSALAGVLSSRSGAEGNAVGVIESTTQATVQAQDHPVTPGTGTASPARSGKGSEARKQQTSPGEPAPAAEAPVEPAYELIPTTIPGVVKLAQPVILSDALSAEQEEQITVKILVTAGGRPVTAMVTRSTNSALDALVVAAVMHSEFEQRAPDQPDHWITIPFSFTR
jgi:TonB family protein